MVAEANPVQFLTEEPCGKEKKKQFRKMQGLGGGYSTGGVGRELSIYSAQKARAQGEDKTTSVSYQDEAEMERGKHAGQKRNHSKASIAVSAG